MQCLDVAQDVEYLHGAEGIIHGGLKGVSVLMNVKFGVVYDGDPYQLDILISSSGRACLADSGCATPMDSLSTWSSAELKRRQSWESGDSGIMPSGTLRWEAPECFDNFDRRPTIATDIYAYGMVCYEVNQSRRVRH
jgi:serine/threonine protein kinase